METIDTVIVGAGHAGLSMSNVLSSRGVEHIVLDRNGIASRWGAERWDTFTLLTPNWATWLPNWRYDGDDPHGFMGRDDIVSYFTRYARSFDAPVRERVEVTAIEAFGSEGYRLASAAGDLGARRVIVATGPFQSGRVPSWSANLPREVTQVHSSRYRNAGLLPDGAVLVVGSGPSGQQIAEDLLRAGRTVYLSVGRHSRVPRSYRGRDYYWWLELGGFYEKTAASISAQEQRHAVAPALTGFGGGHDLDLRQLHARGVTLLGRAVAIRDRRLILEDHLQETLAIGDLAYDKFRDWVEYRLNRFEGLYDEPEEREVFPEPPVPPTELDLASTNISAIVWATGFRRNYDDWIRVPVIGEDGFPDHQRGETGVPGFYFLGLPWQHRLRSPFIRGAEEDAQHIASLIIGKPHG